MARPFALPAGYYTRHARDEFGQPCFDLHHHDLGLVGDGFDCQAEAIYAAQDHADDLADEASEIAAEAAEAGYQDKLDRLHALIAAEACQPLPGDDTGRGELRAVRVVLGLIDGLALMPTATAEAA